MDPRILKWFTIETERWEPLDEAPAIFVPKTRLLSSRLSEHLDDEEVDAVKFRVRPEI